MMYLSNCSKTYATNNQLEEKVSKLMIYYSRFLVDEGLIQAFKDSIIYAIDGFNAEHPRCKPVKIVFELVAGYPNAINDYVVRWNNFPGSNGKHIVEFKLIATK